MKNFVRLLIVLLTLITTACASKPAAAIVLPPKPERREMPRVETLADIALTINYYEALVEEWEAWGDTVTRIISSEPGPADP